MSVFFPDRPWADIRDALPNFDKARLHAALVSTMDRAFPYSLTPNDKKNVAEALRKTIAARCGAWYPERTLWWLSWFRYPYSLNFSRGEPRRTQFVSHANEIIESLTRHHAFLTTLQKIFEENPLTQDPLLTSLQLQYSVTHIIEHVAETTQCDDSWYTMAETSLKWMLQHHGLEMSEAERTEVLQSVRSTFSSWTVRPEQIRHVSDQITMKLVRRLFDASYPAP